MVTVDPVHSAVFNPPMCHYCLGVFHSAAPNLDSLYPSAKSMN